MKTSLHHQTTQSPVPPRIEPWSHSTGHPHPKSLLRSRWAILKRWASEFWYRLATNRYVFYGSLILVASLIAGAVSKGQEVLWRSTAALGTATVIIGFIRAWLDARSAKAGSESRGKRRASKHGWLRSLRHASRTMNKKRLLGLIEMGSPSQVIAASILILAGVAVVDFATGYEIHFFLFCYISVALLAWRVSLRSALVMAVACAIVWFAVDWWLNRYTDLIIEVWNYGIRLAAFLILAVLLSWLRQTHERLSRLNDQLRETLDRMEASMAEAEKLRTQIQTVCAWTKRIKDEGKWVSFEEFLSKHYGLQFTHGISEEALRDLEKQMQKTQVPT